MKFEDQRKMFRELIRKWRPVKCTIDASSLGWDMAEYLEKKFPKIMVLVKMHGSTINMLVEGMVSYCYDQRQLIPDTQYMRESLKLIRSSEDSKGKKSYWIVRSRGKEQSHADEAVGMMLAIESHRQVHGKQDRLKGRALEQGARRRQLQRRSRTVW